MLSGRLYAARWMVATALVGGLMASAMLRPAAGWAQDTVTPIAPPPQQAALPPAVPPPGAPIFTQPQLESMLAPIALYPDQLLSDMLMAAAYPQEVAAADQWVHEGVNASLTGDALNAALAPVDWDPSVKSLVPFPQVLDTMAQHMDWTQQLGEAFVAQQADVMSTVQGLRQRAEADGNLRSTPQLAVASTGGVITIQPAAPTMLYVPVYDPAVIYGPWAYPVPPFAIYPPRVYAAPIIFGVGFAIVRPLWGWNRWDWAHRRVWVDPARVNVINVRLIQEGHRQRWAGNTWHVDASHYHGRPAPAAHAAAIAPHAQPHAGGAPHGQPHAAGRAHDARAPHGPHPARATAPHANAPHQAPVHPAAVHQGPAHPAPQGHGPSHPQAQHAAPAEHGHEEHRDEHH